MRGHFTTHPGGTAMYQPPAPVQTPRRPRWFWITLLAAVVVAGAIVGIVFAVTGGSKTAPKTFMMSGTLTINSIDSGITVVSGSCYGGGGYSDLAPGAAIMVADPQGHVLATGALSAGTPIFTTVNGPGTRQVTAGCRMPFMVGPLPQGLASYSVTVSHRGTQVILPDMAWDVQLTIGGN